MKKIDCEQLAKELRNDKFFKEREDALIQAKESESLYEKCVIMRVYTTPQSTFAENIIKNDLKIKECVDNISGDGTKNGIKYEIKVSVHDRDCKVNIRQIRPHHDIDFYIIVSFNLFKGESGEAYIFKIPANKIYELVADYGFYTHGTLHKNGIISKESIEDINKLHEYSLTANPNAAEETKSKKLWNDFMKYKVEYKKDNF